MISRRSTLRLGVAVGGVGIAGFAAQRAGVLDDGLRAVGVRPRREPDPRDVQLLADAAEGQGELLHLLDLLAEQEGGPDLTVLRAVLSEQLAAVSDTASPKPPDDALARISMRPSPSEFADHVESAAAARANGALAAGSLDVVKVLAAMSAGLEQVAVSARSLA